MTTFEGKSVLVLGGSRGIGAAIVKRFAADGASVTFTYAGSPEAAEKLATGTGSTAVKTDSADRDAVIERVRDDDVVARGPGSQLRNRSNAHDRRWLRRLISQLCCDVNPDDERETITA